MYVAITVFLCLLSITLHELGHAFMMWLYRVRIKEFCPLGWGPQFLEIRHRRYLPGGKLVLRMIPIGASVTPAKNKKMDDPGIPRERILGAGPAANLLFGGLLLALVADFTRQWDSMTVVAVASVVLGFVLLLFPRTIAWIFFICGVAQLGLIAYMLTTNSAGIAGPIGVAKLCGKANSLRHALIIGGAISISIGGMNMLPLLPFDGGKVFLSRLTRALPSLRGETAQNAAIGIMFFAGALLLITVIILDFVHL